MNLYSLEYIILMIALSWKAYNLVRFDILPALKSRGFMAQKDKHNEKKDEGN
jgi:hypothetical protein